MKVVICGAGIGGLVLAHALTGRADVLVLERDAYPASTGGYRISINDEAVRALVGRLPTSLLSEIRAVSDGANEFRQFTLADSKLRPIVVAPEPRGGDRILAQRQVLRVLLARDLAPIIRYGATITAVVQSVDGATVRLADGATVEADVVVGADGADSAVVSSLLGTSPTRDLGLTGIAGWSDLDGSDPPSYLRQGPALAFGRDGTGVFLSLYRPPSVNSADPELNRLIGTTPALIWGTIARSDRLAPTRSVAPEALTSQALQLATGWAPWLTDRIRRSDQERTATFRFRAADPDRPTAAWKPQRVTALGDAIHAMPPTGGRGASTAICDADDLAAALIAHIQGGEPLADVLERYQRSIGPRSRAAIRESLGPVKIINALQYPGVRLVARPVLAIAAAIGSRRYGGRS